MTRNVAFIVAYDGTNFSGSQRQTNARSVQGDLENAVREVFGESVNVALSGRTDAGVHATGQVGRFALSHSIPIERVHLALNCKLERDVRLVNTWEADESWHPRFSAKSRVYRYTIFNAPIVNPLLRCFTGHVRDVLNVEAMRELSTRFVGEHDFASWQSAGSPSGGGTVRNIIQLEVAPGVGAFGLETIEVEIEANGFLYQMVRNIVGALIEAGKMELSTGEIDALFAGRDRTKCPPPAPPQGLCLVEVKY
jgi:tRNA pseudouridine38-40 synthase